MRAHTHSSTQTGSRNGEEWVAVDRQTVVRQTAWRGERAAGRPSVWRSPRPVPAPCGLCAALHRATGEGSPSPPAASAGAPSAERLQCQKTFSVEVCSVSAMSEISLLQLRPQCVCNVRKHSLLKYAVCLQCQKYLFCSPARRVSAMSENILCCSLIMRPQCQKTISVEVCSVSAMSENISVAGMSVVCL